MVLVVSGSRFFCCTTRRVSISCHPPPRVACPCSRLSLLPGPRLGGRQEVLPTLTPPLTQPSLPVLRGLAVLFHTFSTKQLFLHPGHVHAQGWEVGGDRPCRHIGCIYEAQVLSHAIWGSSLYLIPVTSKWGPWWPEPLGFEVCVWQFGAWGVCTVGQNSPCIWPRDFTVMGHRGLGSWL